MKTFTAILLAVTFMAGPWLGAAVNAWNGIAITTASTINGITPIAAINGITVTPSTPPPTADIVWLKMDEGTGTALNNSAAAGVDFTTNATWATGLDFNGTDDFAQSDSPITYGAVITAMAWINFDDITTVQALFESGPNANTTARSILVYVGGSKIGVLISGNTGALAVECSSPATGTSRHIAVTADNSFDQGGGIFGKIQVYVNGVLQTLDAPLQNDSSAMTDFVAATMNVGMRNATTFPFAGIMDDFRIYGSSLSGAEIASIYAAGPQ